MSKSTRLLPWGLMIVIGFLCCPIVLQAAALFETFVNYGGGVSPTGVVIVDDLDGDGVVDVALANSTSDNVSLFFGVGDGTFGAATAVAVGDNPLGIRSDDFDGDGDQDLVTTNDGSSNNISILLNAGDGTFASAANYFFGSFPGFVTTGDFDEDDDADVAVCSSGVAIVGIFENNGLGVFNASSTIANTTTCIGVSTADLNEDGHLDLVTTHSGSSNNVHVLTGNGDGTFDPPVTYTAGTLVFTAVIEDFDDDGDLDLAAGNRTSNNISILLNDGTGLFGTATNFTVAKPYEIASGDFNNDGVPDLAAADWDGQMTILLGNGDGTFAPRDVYSMASCTFCVWGVAAGDLNNDGADDVVISRDFGSPDGITVFMNQMQTGQTVASGVTLADVAEGSTQAGLYLTLPIAPSTTVSITVETDDDQVSFNDSTFTFTPANYADPQLLLITAVDDAVIEGEHSDTVSFTLTSDDPAYDGYLVDSVTVTISDNDGNGGLFPLGAGDEPVPPPDGFRFSINNGASKTINPVVRLDFHSGPDTTQVAIGNDPLFADGIVIPDQPFTNWSLCGQCSDGVYTVYARYYNKWGQTSPTVSQQIFLDRNQAISVYFVVELSGGARLLKTPNNPAVYYVTSAGERYVFNNAQVYRSWFGDDFGQVETVSAAALAQYPLTGVVQFKPGTLVKITTDPKVYVVGVDYRLEWVPSEDQARLRYGTDWAKQVRDVADVDFAGYGFAASI